MERVIWKYELDIGENIIALPEESLGVTVVAQSTGLHVFMAVPRYGGDGERTRETRIVAVPTGQPFDDEGLAYIASVRPREGEQFVHVFADVRFDGNNGTGSMPEQDDTDADRATTLPSTIGIILVG